MKPPKKPDEAGLPRCHNCSYDRDYGVMRQGCDNILKCATVLMCVPTFPYKAYKKLHEVLDETTT